MLISLWRYSNITKAFPYLYELRTWDIPVIEQRNKPYAHSPFHVNIRTREHSVNKWGYSGPL